MGAGITRANFSPNLGCTLSVSQTEEARLARKVFHSIPNDGGWKVKSDGRTISQHRTQRASEKAAIAASRRVEAKGGLAQAVLHKANNRIREERTYGKDPRRSRG